MRHGFCLAVVVVLMASSGASAGYLLSPQSGGTTSVTVEWGDSFTLDLVLSSDAGDVHNSADFNVVFTRPGLIYDAYDWGDPYVDGSPDDVCIPDAAALPMAIDAATLDRPGDPAGVVDVELTNVVLGGQTFGEGRLVSLDLTVPADYGYEGSVYISTMPDTFAEGFTEIPTTTGLVFELDIIPEPTSLAFLLGGVAMLSARGRRR